MHGAVLVLATVCGLVAVVILGASTSTFDIRMSARKPVTARGATSLSAWAARGTGAAMAAAVVILLSGWVGPAIVLAAGVWWAVAAFQGRARGARHDLDRVEALAIWTENLRDVLIAGDQPVGAITSTVSTAPPAVRGPVRRLASRLAHQEPEVVLRQFADEIDDPLGDLIATGLLIAIRRGARTAGVLSALADQARFESDRRRLVEAERAPTTREINVLIAIMGALLIGLMVFGRSDYLVAYETLTGQVVLSAALFAYGGLLIRVRHLASFPRPGRFLTSQVTS